VRLSRPHAESNAGHIATFLGQKATRCRKAARLDLSAAEALTALKSVRVVDIDLGDSTTKPSFTDPNRYAGPDLFTDEHCGASVVTSKPGTDAERRRELPLRNIGKQLDQQLHGGIDEIVPQISRFEREAGNVRTVDDQRAI
jgi:hypothetical protein